MEIGPQAATAPRVDSRFSPSGALRRVQWNGPFRLRHKRCVLCTRFYGKDHELYLTARGETSRVDPRVEPGDQLLERTIRSDDAIEPRLVGDHEEIARLVFQRVGPSVATGQSTTSIQIDDHRETQALAGFEAEPERVMRTNCGKIDITFVRTRVGCGPKGKRSHALEWRGRSSSSFGRDPPASVDGDEQAAADSDTARFEGR